MVDGADLNDTARLVLMGTPSLGFRAFHLALKQEAQVGLAESREIYERYMGWDGRVLPSHDLATGRPLR